MANNTGNPIGSTAAKDLSDNAENLDKMLNGGDYEYDDRLGRARKSLKWMEDAALAIPAIDAAQRSEQQAERSEAEAERALAARMASETARDSAQLSVGIFDDVATGLLPENTLSGQYFSVPNPSLSSYLTLYKNNAGSALEIDSYPNARAVQQPAWAGKKNGWPDPFFRVFDLKSQFLLGVDRWWCNAGSASDTQTPLQQGGWSRVRSTYFDGYVLHRTPNVGAVPLNGPVVILSEIDVVVGDTITAYQLFSGNGAVVNAAARFDNGSDRGYVGPQSAMLSDGGAATVVSSSSLQRMKVSMVVPVGAKRLLTYAYTTTPDATFDLVSLWAFRGTVDQGPTWPSMDEAAVTGYRVAQVTQRLDVTEPATAYAVDSFSKVTQDAEAAVLNGTGYSTFPRDLVFMGWGEVYSPAGVAFNALRVKAISRPVATTAKWKTLHCVVRTGPSPESAVATVVAAGKVTVLEQDASLSDVTFVLRDPVTGAVKVLTDADFTDGKYFIGVWALASDGSPAACGEPRGTMPNSMLQAYYHVSTTNRPQTGAWNAASAGANSRQAFEHLNLTNPVEVTQYAPSAALAAALGTNAAVPVPELVTPPFMYGLQDREISFYFDNVMLCAASDYSIDTAATGGSQQDERLVWTATGAAASGALTLTVNDKRTGASLASAVVQQRAAAASAGAGLTMKCLFIGDSLIAANTITQTLLELANSDAMKIELLGTLGSGLNKHEGRGGWTVANYTSAGTASYRFTVSGVVEPPAINSAEYSHSGAVYRVQEAALVGGAGTLTCSLVSGGVPLASGTLTKTNAAAGDATIAFSATATLSGNPFWFSGAVNFGQYLTTNSIAAPGWVFIGLAINDVFAATSDNAALVATDTALARLDVLLASIKAADSTTKVGLMIPTPPSSEQNSFGVNYGTGQNRDRFKRNILIWARQLIAKHKGQEANRIYLVPSNTALDTVNNMQRGAAAPVNSRSSIIVSRQNNGVHPDTSGYQQIGDALWAFLKCKA